MAKIDKVEINGTQMRYAVLGEGRETVCLFPGLAAGFVCDSANAVEKMYGKYLDRFSVCLFDRVDEPKDGYSLSEMADDTFYAIKSLGIDKTHIYGVSQGGMIAQIIASNQSEAVKSAVFASSCVYTTELLKKSLSEWISFAKSKDRKSFAHSFVYSVYSKATTEKFGASLEMVHSGYSDEQLDRFAILANASIDFDFQNQIGKIKCPALALGAKGDKVIGVGGTYDIANVLECEKFIYGDEYGHGVYDEASDFTDRLFGFFEKHSR